MDVAESSFAVGLAASRSHLPVQLVAESGSVEKCSASGTTAHTQLGAKMRESRAPRGCPMATFMNPTYPYNQLQKRRSTALAASYAKPERTVVLEQVILKDYMCLPCGTNYPQDLFNFHLALSVTLSNIAIYHSRIEECDVDVRNECSSFIS